MSLRYKKVFSVDILHDYYSNGFCSDLEIIPARDTATMLSAHGMICKSLGNKLVVLIRTDSSDKPYAGLSKSSRLKFYLRLNNPHFNNFTNLSYLPSKPERYYFSNINQTKIGTVLYLNSKIPAYSASNDQPVGIFASNASDEVFEAIKSSSSAAAQSLINPDYWLNRGKVQYVNSNDLLEFTPYVYLFHTLGATHFLVDVFGFNVTSGDYDLPVTESVSHTFSEIQTTVPVRFETLPPGKYLVQVNGASKLIYFDGEAVYQNVFGMIELFNHLPASNAFALFNAQGKPKATSFTLRFANRSVIWKYLARTNDITSVEDFSPISPLSFISQAGNQFVSDRPIPLSEKPRTTLMLKSTALGDITPVANPRNDRMGIIVQDGNTYLCSELYLNY
jgi:hypothetical protein